MLQQALEPTATPDESEEAQGEEINTGEKVGINVITRPKCQSLNSRIFPSYTFKSY
jgi:hypothetical protein